MKMEIFSLFRLPSWIYIFIVLSLVGLSEQNDTEDQFVKLENLINAKFSAVTEMYTEINTRMWEMKDKLDMIETAVKNQGTEIIGDIEMVKQVCRSSHQVNEDIIESIMEVNDSVHKSFMMINATNKEKSLLTFNPSNVLYFVGEEARFDCGVVGLYQACNWENNGLIYQLDDIRIGSIPNVTAASNNNINQCGIVVSSITSDHNGTWTCNILTHGNILAASKYVIIERDRIIFDPTDVAVSIGQDIQLDCGIIGVYDRCYWKHDDVIYQINDIKNGTYSNIKSSPISISQNNQCGIQVTSVNLNHRGSWSCHVNTNEKIFEASKTVHIECSEGFVRHKGQSECFRCQGEFFQSKGSNQCFKLYQDRRRVWNNAKRKCDSEGLRLAEPSDGVAINLRKDLLDKYGSDDGPWLGARGVRGVNNKFVWQSSGATLRSDNPLWDDGSTYFDDGCLELDQQQSGYNAKPNQPYDGEGCTYVKYTLCEVITD